MIEWAIQYRDERQPDMSGKPRVTTHVVRDEATARQVLTWSFGQWAKREVRVVWREVGEWEAADDGPHQEV